jgi:methionyl-tRNA synthetase
MKKKILVTSALPYVNNIPHLGTLVCVLSADVFTRYLRLRRENVISVCGTDEHGTTAEVKALEEGLTPRQLVDKYYKIHREIYEWFNCSFDCFGRTSSQENKEITIDIFNKLDKNGYIIENELEQSYCSKCKKFLSDRFVEGECPHCGYKHARGDQCEKCGKLLSATELVDARCKICCSKPEIRKSRHLFIDLPKIEPKLRKWIDKVKKRWSLNAVTMTDGWLKEGIKPRCITRDLEWGIPVPKKGFENKVFYSWFDAPIGYIGITKENRDDWKSWWLGKDVRLVQFMGKDNIPFHTILFPSFLIGTGDDYTLVSDLSVNEYLNYEGGMFSKSRNVGIFGDDARATGIPADVWRYYIMVNRPERADSEFSWEDFQAKINNELVANIGNLVNRTITFINRFFDSNVGEVKLNEKDKRFLDNLRKSVNKTTNLLDDIKLRDALREIMLASKAANQYFQENEPWFLLKKDKARALSVISLLANVVKDLSIMIEPFMPDVADEIRNQINTHAENWEEIGKLTIKKGHKVNKARVIFNKLEDKKMKEFQQRFSSKKPLAKELPLNLKVGKIVDVKDHPNANKLQVLKVDIGGEQRHLVAGLKGYYKNNELKGKHIVVVTNLKPAKLRGIESNGMLLAADDGKNVKLLLAEKSSPGEQVLIEGAKPGSKEISFDEFQKIRITVKDKKIICDGKILKTEKEEVAVDIGDGAKVR